MRLSVQFYARLRDLSGRREWACELPAGARVADVWRTATAEMPALAAFSGAVTCAVNSEFARMESSLEDGDAVAFLPPVSGGAE